VTPSTAQGEPSLSVLPPGFGQDSAVRTPATVQISNELPIAVQ